MKAGAASKNTHQRFLMAQLPKRKPFEPYPQSVLASGRERAI
jgi:hypothetical protein